MKITKVEPLLVDRFCLVRIETDVGITGIGEAGAWGQLEASATAARFTAAGGASALVDP
jgi:galactonate dehydratase